MSISSLKENILAMTSKVTLGSSFASSRSEEVALYSGGSFNGSSSCVLSFQNLLKTPRDFPWLIISKVDSKMAPLPE